MAMEARVGVLEKEMGEMKGMLKHLIEAVADLSKTVGKKHEEPATEESVGASSQTESRLAGKKVKLPLFDGEDPVAWITRAEIYFDVQNTMDEMCVKLARLSMEGSTIHWFNLLMETEDELSWEKLKRAMIARYGGRRLENPFEELSTLTQKGSVEEFVESFELLSSQVGRLPEQQYLGYFMSGLKPQIRRRVRTLNPRNRMEMMRIAKDVEDELREVDDEGDRRSSRKGGYEKKDWAGLLTNRSGSQPKDPTRSFSTGGSNPNQKSGPIGSNTGSTSSSASTARKNDGGSRGGTGERWKGVRFLSNEEFEERRAKGQCFKCGGKYHPLHHKCPEGSLRVLILGPGETMNEEGEIVRLEVDVDDDDEEIEVESVLLIAYRGK
jgi:hypothetical protein